MKNRYQEWLECFFKHESDDWYHELDRPEFVMDPNEAADIFIQTFEKCDEDLERYSYFEVGQALSILAGDGTISYFVDIRDSKDVPLDKKIRLIRSIYFLYKDCFAKRCPVGNKYSKMNNACYMFWDNCALRHTGSYPEGGAAIGAVILDVLESILAIDDVTCKHGALHGLGHQFKEYPNEVKSIIDNFLNQNVVDQNLKNYALDAITGRIQ